MIHHPSNHHIKLQIMSFEEDTYVYVAQNESLQVWVILLRTFS